MTICIRSIFIRNTCICNTSAVGIWTGCASNRYAHIKYICAKIAFVESVELRALIGSRVILAS